MFFFPLRKFSLKSVREFAERIYHFKDFETRYRTCLVFFFHKICHDDAKEILLGIQSSNSQVYPRKSACVIFSDELLILAVEKLKNSRPLWSN